MVRNLTALRQTFGAHQYTVDISKSDVLAHPVNAPARPDVDIVICTAQGLHLLEDLPVPAGIYSHREFDVEPELLLFECRTVLAEAFGEYDYYCFLEDDMAVTDPLLFEKLDWFNEEVGPPALLQANSFERSMYGGGCKIVYGSLPASWSEPFQDVRTRPTLTVRALGRSYVFRRTTNPHAQSYFLNGDQLEHWMRHPSFLDRSTSFVGPLESGASLGIMQAFDIYKPGPENPGFLELEHLDPLIFAAADGE